MAAAAWNNQDMGGNQRGFDGVNNNSAMNKGIDECGEEWIKYNDMMDNEHNNDLIQRNVGRGRSTKN